MWATLAANGLGPYWRWVVRKSRKSNLTSFCILVGLWLWLHFELAVVTTSLQAYKGH